MSNREKIRDLLLVKGAHFMQSIHASATIAFPPDYVPGKMEHAFIQDEYAWLGLCICVREWLPNAGVEVFVAHGPINSGPGFEWFSDYVLAEMDFVVELLRSSSRTTADHLALESNGRKGPLLDTWTQGENGAESHPR